MKKIHILCLFILITVVFLCNPPRPVRADIAPPPPPESGNIQPYSPTQVRMMAEKVLVDVAATTGKTTPYAKVTAAFTMRNLGSQEEQMDVRFPLNLLFPQYQSDIEECPYPQGNFPEISNFTAQVNGEPAAVSTIYKRIAPFDGGAQKEVACWAAFSVAFPPQKDVLIEVSYTAEGYFSWNVTGLVEFPYVMVTGEGWAGTIGVATITLRAPYELNAQTLMGYYPEPATITGREIHWRFVDQEPGSNVGATIVNPAVWDRVNKERQAVERNSQDGEAWGRLGKAYKETIMLNRGFRWDEGGPVLFQFSREAYEKCVTLLPRDADWHFGYGELLWWNAAYSAFGSNIEKRDDLVKAAEQFSLALQINPNHARALEELDNMRWFGSGGEPLVDLDGKKPVFLLLTTTPTAQPTEIAIIIQTATTPFTETPLPPTPTATTAATAPITSTVFTTEIASAPTAAGSTELDPTITPTPAGKTGGRFPCTAGLIPLVGMTWIAIRKLSRG